jgi:Lar family restriction alleviation protein
MTQMLKPCPFCGSDKVQTGVMSFGDGDVSRVVCMNCHVEGPNGASEEAAIERWNTRASSIPEPEAARTHYERGFGPGDGFSHIIDPPEAASSDEDAEWLRENAHGFVYGRRSDPPDGRPEELNRLKAIAARLSAEPEAASCTIEDAAKVRELIDTLWTAWLEAGRPLSFISMTGGLVNESLEPNNLEEIKKLSERHYDLQHELMRSGVFKAVERIVARLSAEPEAVTLIDRDAVLKLLDDSVERWRPLGGDPQYIEGYEIGVADACAFLAEDIKRGPPYPALTNVSSRKTE